MLRLLLGFCLTITGLGRAQGFADPAGTERIAAGRFTFVPTQASRSISSPTP